jgi:hypothetical protein
MTGLIISTVTVNHNSRVSIVILKHIILYEVCNHDSANTIGSPLYWCLNIMQLNADYND